MATGDIRAELRRTWEAAAPGWARWEGVFAAGLAEATETMLDMAGVAAGMRVLDLACGAGSQSLRAAERVGADGQVVAIDISATMLAQVQAAARRRGLGNIETLEGAAEDLPSTLGAFDAAICRLALMLFPAPGQALQAVQRVLKPKARVAALVVSAPAANPFLWDTMAILLRHAAKEPPPAGRPGLFALGGQGVLAALLADSGLADVQARAARASLRVASAAEALVMMQEAFGAYRAIIADLDAETRAAAWAEVGECLQRFEDHEGFRAEVELILGSGTRGG
jgi:SAM-dependent methyltransferase